jgi:predicted enzyme related to lactoylglutathione lyase
MPEETIIDRTEYLPGVPCFIDTEQPDPAAAAAFYGGVFGWEFENKLPPGTDSQYLVASLRGFVVAAIASPTAGVPVATWNTYVSVADVDATAAQAVELGAELLVAPVDAGPPGAVAGRWAHIVGPDGAHLRLWQPGLRHGAELVNYPGSWNSSNLMTDDAPGARAFCGALFGWEADAVDFGGGDVEGESFQWRLPGYGDYLAIRDPDIKRRHDEPWVPEGFSDVIGWMTAGSGEPSGKSGYWNVTFGVDGTDAVVERAVELGAAVVSPPADRGGGIVRVATIRDPQGAEFTVGSFDPSKLAA